ncbi:MAG: minor capsid protein [[Pasteurella] mairii]|uniref:Phage head morphogenesis protein, SPP1 gp7 family n=1 Tax=[Pasteurella] mairii TaxID=757 RepID=A0A379B3U9_9PAST|nr:minor capsid protein [[Pasteurella] mairii]SUB33313.1 phage head morphogenesis protein, SPP1 gp7 family [[Pasteurella] mairii]
MTLREMTVDEHIESLLTDRKILLFRYDAYLRAEITKKLTALQKQLLQKISASGIESISKRELQQLLKEIKGVIVERYAEINDFSSDELNALLPVEVAATTQLYNQAVKFDLFNQIPDTRLKAINSALVINGTPLKDWWSKQGDDLVFKFSALVRQGMLEGKQSGQLVTEVKALMGNSRRYAETLVRTSVMKVHDRAQEMVRDENRDILNGEQHLSTLDMRTSETCRARDGLAWDLNKNPIGDHNVPYARPPLHPNCRSTLKLLTKSWRELGIDLADIPESTRASMDGQVKAGMTYEDWLKTKTPAQQDAVLGKGKADLWRNGVITFRDMLDQSGRPLTLKQLQDIQGMPEAVRSIMRKHWSDSFKQKTIAIYYQFEKQGIILDQHCLARLGERLAKVNLTVEEAIDVIKATPINYIDTRNGRFVRFNQRKKVAVIQSKKDGKIITFERKGSAKSDNWIAYEKIP